ncbi:S8 family serine peptidase [Kibdelosporangium persicum]|uniref:Subtilisin family serine protease n=1 Tax=Kibdelosporangium persicum TaxID=2698649 RepID=A0ABX2F901_9PSEU|nr:S8 family serine peptidase [Kibdelosporangium persicum]NRN67838.1 Subtilisin family serine protease [Kibdelosporangium persicum]
MRGTVHTAVLAVLISGLTGLPAAADPARNPSARPEPARTVTLITGDKVTVTQRGDTWDAHVEPAKRIGAPRGFVKSVTADGVTVIPSDAVPLVASGRLDKALFDVTGLIKLGYDDAHTSEIPLLVESGPSVSALGKVTRDLPAVKMAAVSTPKQRATDLFETAKAHRIWLNGKAYPSLDQSVPQVGAPAAWQAGHTGAGATIAVLDTGYDPGHPDLAGIVKGEKDFTGEGIQDQVGHGTHVASTAAGRGGRYTGVAKDANLLVGKVCANYGCPFDAILEGMQWAADNGAKVVNMSLGGGPGDGTDPIETAVNRISAEKGTLFVIAAGNYGPSQKVSSPAAADAALAVASVNKQDQASQFSSPGPRANDFAVKPDIAAPGEAIVAARAKGTLDDEAVDEHYARLTGTSMATPHVAGAAAILAAQHPDWNGQQIKAALMGAASPVSATIYQQGAGRLDVGRAVSQTVVASTGSLSMGFIQWPHRTDKITKPVTYKNSGGTPVSLTLELQDAGVFSTDVKEITVPAQGEATVNVTFDPAAGPVAEYSGRLVARGGGTVVQTAIGATKEPESYTLTPKLTDRNGVELGPDGAGAVIWKRIDADFYDIAPSNRPVRLPAGKYAVFGLVQTLTAGQVQPSVTMVGEPEVDLRQDTTVAFDARQGVRVDVRVEEPEARRAAGVTAIVVHGFDGRGVGFSSDVTDETYAVPTKGSFQHFDYYNRQQLGRPSVRLAAGKPESFDIPVEWAPSSPMTNGHKEFAAVDVGHATPEEIATRDLKGKLAVFTLGRTDAREYDARVKAVADAGAAAALFYFSETMSIAVREKAPVPVVYTMDPAGQRLAKLGNATVTLTGLPASPYRYELAFPHHGGIPGNLTYQPRSKDLATVKAKYHAQTDGVAYIDYRTRSGNLQMGSGLWSTVVPLPLERTEYYSPVTWQNSFRTAPNRDSGPEQGYINDERTYRAGEQTTSEWGKAVIGPGLAVSNEPYTGQPHLAFREADTITATLPLFSDAARHSGFPRPEEYSFADKGDTVLYADGKEIGRSDVPGDGTFTVPAAAANYRLTSEVTRTSPIWPLSTKVSAEWTFRSGHTDKATPLPLLTVGFDPKLDLRNNARANSVLAIPVRVDRQPGSAGGGASLRTVEVSTDDGTLWRRAPLVRVHDQWWAIVWNPSSGFVSLRAQASYPDGNTVSQTVIRAYRVK